MTRDPELDEDERAGASTVRGSDGSGCTRCGSALESMGVVELRTGGTGPGAHLLFGQWAELGEGKLPVEMFSCSAYGHIEMFVPR